jgi:putative sigma-54 modulation protein
MHIEVVARHMSMSDDERRHAEGEAEKLGKFFDGVNEIKLTFDREHDDVKAEVVCLVSGGKTLVAHANGDTVHESLEFASDSMARQIKKHKAKLRDHRLHGEPGQATEADEDDDLVDEMPDDEAPDDNARAEV